MNSARNITIGLVLVAVALVVLLRGGPSGFDDPAPDRAAPSAAADRAPSPAAADGDLPLAETSYVMGDDLAAYRDFMMSGGPPPDGIPSVDDPRFVSADEADLEPGSPVIGFEHGGEARAYPQNIVVYHEIVNDRVGGLSVSVTYCPLTATAQVFERDGTTLGVSGQLLNSNLVMYDRATESYCP